MLELLINQPGRIALMLGIEDLMGGVLEAAFVATNCKGCKEGMTVTSWREVAA